MTADDFPSGVADAYDLIERGLQAHQPDEHPYFIRQAIRMLLDDHRAVDALLLVDVLERHDLDSLTALETEALVNLYTLCSDVQRNADSLRKDIADVLLNR